MNPQQQMQSKLCSIGIPYKEIRCYGQQIMITAWSCDAANRWASLLQRFATTVRKPGRSIDYNVVNRGTNLNPTTHEVWRVWATL